MTRILFNQTPEQRENAVKRAQEIMDNLKREQYKGWTIIKNNDGFIALDPQGHNVIPGGGGHATVEDAHKSVDFYILSKGDVHLFHLLWGQAGWDHLAVHESAHGTDGVIHYKYGKRDNEKRLESYDYCFRLRAQADINQMTFEFRTVPAGLRNVVLSPESALALSNLLRQAAVEMLESKVAQ